MVFARCDLLRAHSAAGQVEQARHPRFPVTAFLAVGRAVDPRVGLFQMPACTIVVLHRSFDPKRGLHARGIGEELGW
jgi:hypothetical protein